MNHAQRAAKAATRIIRREVPADLPLEGIFALIRQHVLTLETAWLKCHAKHVESDRHLERLAGIWRAEGPGRDIILGLCGSNVRFSTEDDFNSAMALALRAYQEGLANRPAADQAEVAHAEG